MTWLDARSARGRFLTLVALRWLPTGLLVPITVLLPLERGLSLAEIGVVFSVQGFVVLALELPTGGLSDSLGRRPVLILSNLVNLVSLGLFFLAESVPAFMAAVALQGVYRALDSGPLEAWYVDATLADDPDAQLERGLSAGSVALSAAIAAGALVSGGLVALDPVPSIDALALPVLAALVLGVINLTALILLVTEVRPARGLRAVATSVRAVPHVIGGGLRLVRASRVLLTLVLVELFWGFGMVTFEILTPIRLAEVVEGTDSAAALMGPVSSAAWLASAAGAASITLLSRRIGVAPTAAAMRLLQGTTVVGMGVLGGSVGVITAFLACYAVHGASNPMHRTLLHRHIEGPNRATVLSIDSMAGQPAFAVGLLALGALAEGTSVTTAMIIGAVALAVAAPLYLPAWRAEKARSAVAAG